MKKSTVLFLFLSLVLCFSSCNKFNQSHGETNNNTQQSSESDKIINLNNYEYKTQLYQMSDSGTILNDDFKTDIAAQEFDDPFAKKQIREYFFGELYELEYVNSVRLPRSDMVVNVYRVPSDNIISPKIWVNAATNEIVRLQMFPNKISLDKLESESEYADFLSNMLGGHFDLTTYEYSCTTYIRDETGRAKTVDGFYKCAENETLREYLFNYKKYVNGLPTASQIIFSVDSKYIALTVYDFEYDSNVFDPLLQKQGNIEDRIAEYVKEKFISEEYILKNISNISIAEYFTVNDTPYVLVSFVLTVSKKNDVQQNEWNAIYQTVSWVEARK